MNTVSKNVAYCKEENIHIILANILEYFMIWVFPHITKSGGSFWIWNFSNWLLVPRTYNLRRERVIGSVVPGGKTWNQRLGSLELETLSLTLVSGEQC